MTRTIIFDMDGVIIDSEPIHMETEQEMFHSLGLTVTKTEHAAMVGTSSRNMWERMVNTYGLHFSVEDLVEENKRLYLKKLKSSGAKPVDGVETLIHSLHNSGHKIGLASSSDIENIETVLSLLSLTKFFSEIVSGADLPQSKPHPMIFLKAVTQLRSDPRVCVVIEDSENGIKAAKAAGMKCIGYRNPGSGNQDLSLADTIVDSFSKVDISFINSI